MNLEHRAARRVVHPIPEQVHFVLADTVWHLKLSEAFAVFGVDFDQQLSLAVRRWTGGAKERLEIRADGVFLDVWPHEIKTTETIRIRDREVDLKLRQMDSLFSLKLARALSLSSEGDIFVEVPICFPYSPDLGDRITSRVLLDELEVTND